MKTSEIQSLKGAILVLGAAGYVGANLFFKLQAVCSDGYAFVRSWR